MSKDWWGFLIVGAALLLFVLYFLFREHRIRHQSVLRLRPTAIVLRVFFHQALFLGILSSIVAISNSIAHREFEYTQIFGSAETQRDQTRNDGSIISLAIAAALMGIPISLVALCSFEMAFDYIVTMATLHFATVSIVDKGFPANGFWWIALVLGSCAAILTAYAFCSLRGQKQHIAEFSALMDQRAPLCGIQFSWPSHERIPQNQHNSHSDDDFPIASSHATHTQQQIGATSRIFKMKRVRLDKEPNHMHSDSLASKDQTQRHDHGESHSPLNRSAEQNLSKHSTEALQQMACCLSHLDGIDDGDEQESGIQIDPEEPLSELRSIDQLMEISLPLSPSRRGTS
eukprot:TRINITY_DN11593_c0_g1_i1.p1 TRINITY_DN11593_c0_g1~~TRINITY_DN11593_c0_g1_i1.p1  ORF type:complete len:344 (+),score=78.96 TRINITY_DN11593_c0_g1_i1:49-1080(+)